MEEPIVEVLDLTPVLEALDTVNTHLIQLEANTDYIFLGVMILCGVVVGCCIGWLLHDLWRS